MRRITQIVACACAATLSLVSCGGTGSRSISARTRTELDALARQLRRAAAEGDFAGAHHALTELQQTVTSDERKGELGSARGKQILQAAAGVANFLALTPNTTSTSTATTATTTTASVEPTTSNPPTSSGKGHKPKGRKDK